MAKQNARVGKSYLGIVSELTVNNIRMQAQDISNWVKAIDAARSETNPKRKQLIELYEQIRIDGHLESVMNKRRIAVTNKRLHFNEKGSEGEENEFVRDWVTETPWMHQLLGHIMDSKAYGHSLVELIPSKKDKGTIEKSVLIPRFNVKPETGFLMWHYANETEGIHYREDPKYSKYLIEAGGEKNYGLLMIAAQYVIYKRGGFGDWAQFAELFGMPFRVGKYNPYDDSTRQKLAEALKEMGGAGHTVIPDGTSLEFHNPANSGQSDIFKDLVKECNAEISKTFLGQTMTTEDGSSRSQSETHKEVEEGINLADLIEVEYLLNWDVAEKLREIGMPVPEGRFYFDQSQKLSLDQRIKVDLEVAKQVKIKPEYWYETYGVEVPDGGPEEVEKALGVKPTFPPEDPKKGSKDNPPPKGEPEGASKKKEPTNQLTIDCCSGDHPHNTHDHPLPITAQLNPEEEDLLKKIHASRGIKYDPATLRKNTDKLKDAVRQAFPVTAGYGEPDHLMGTMMELNVNRFGFNKNLVQILELNKALDPEETFSQFKQKAEQILENYNRTYLETEYNLAIATAQNAAAWQRQKAEADRYPYLQYQTVGDSNVRPSHQALDGMIFRVDDPSWRNIYPPNGYNCRCEMIQLPASLVNPADVKGGTDAVRVLGDDWTRMVETGFNKNRGETSDIFELNKVYIQDHPEARDIDINKLTYKDAGLDALSKAFKDSRRAMAISRTASKETLLSSFDTRKRNVGGKDLMILKDYSGRSIGIDRKVMGAGDPKTWRNVKPALTAPDEIYLVQDRDTMQGVYRYLKFYKDTIMVTEATVSGEGMTISKWYQATEAEARRGILIHSNGQ